MKRTLFLLLTLSLSGAGGSLVAANTIVETAPAGYPVFPGGCRLVGGGYLGVRFEVTQPVELTGVGAVLSQFDPAHAGPIESAVVRLAGPWR